MANLVSIRIEDPWRKGVLLAGQYTGSDRVQPCRSPILKRQSVESYLAIKYGITLNNGNTDYLSSII